MRRDLDESSRVGDDDEYSKTYEINRIIFMQLTIVLTLDIGMISQS